eukprot:354266-Chlamydomonas_euryale.AAC.15
MAAERQPGTFALAEASGLTASINPQRYTLFALATGAQATYMGAAASSPCLIALPHRPASSPSLIALPRRPASSPCLIALPNRPASSPCLIALPHRPASSPCLIALPHCPASSPCTSAGNSDQLPST